LIPLARLLDKRGEEPFLVIKIVRYEGFSIWAFRLKLRLRMPLTGSLAMYKRFVVEGRQPKAVIKVTQPDKKNKTGRPVSVIISASEPLNGFKPSPV